MNSFQKLFELQKRAFATGVTRTYAWRIEQLDRMARLVSESETALQRAVAADFKRWRFQRADADQAGRHFYIGGDVR